MMRLTPGALRLRFAHGPRVAYWRDIVRPRILDTRPIIGANDRTCEVHALTSKDDWLNLVWVLKSFYHASGRRYALCIHDDGTLDERAADHLARHFPDASLIRGDRADRESLSGLADYPRCQTLRRSNRLSMKLFDFRHYLRADRMLLLDSDVLFFTEPTELVRRIEDLSYRYNSANGDIDSVYTLSSQVARAAGVELIPRFNSGLGLIHRDSLNLDWLEEFLGLPGITGHFWRIEQTLFALCSSRFGGELLPEEYSVRIRGGRAERPVRHYVGTIRHLFYGEGVRDLWKGHLWTREDGYAAAPH